MFLKITMAQQGSNLRRHLLGHNDLIPFTVLHPQCYSGTVMTQYWMQSGLILGLHLANGRWRYLVTKLLIGWVQA